MRPWWRYLCLTLGSVGVGVGLFFRVWQHDYIHYPLVYSHDGLDFIAGVKSVIDTGSVYADNLRLGAPYSANKLADFYAPDGLLLGLIRILVVILGDRPFLITNVFIVGSFMTVAMTAYVAACRLGLKPALAAAIAIVYTFLPYHFVRISAGHLFLTYYLSAPLAGYLALRLATTKPGLPRQQRRSALWKGVLVIGIIGSTGTGYYAFFAAGIILFGGLIGAIWNHSLRPIGTALGWTAGIAIVLLINVAPTLIYQYSRGKNTIVTRDAAQTEAYGLRLSRLVTPLPTTILPGFKESSLNFYRGVTHEYWQYIGLLATIGLGYALYLLILPTPGSPEKAAALTIGFMLAWGLAGGLAYEFSFFISPVIRAYNRLSVEIAFLALWLVARGYERLNYRLKSPLLAWIFGGCLLLSVWDQGATALPHQHFFEIRQRVMEDQAFVREIESRLPAEAMVYQLPYMPYPEGAAQCGFDSYDHMSLYINSRRLKWSFGGVKGREADAWSRRLSELPGPALAQLLREAGFKGLVIDRTSCLDGVALETLIKPTTSQAAYYSPDNRRIFIPL